ncbi:MAG TPA: hypothetical protein VM490_20045 [Armatimonadaceae bacterium]|nr:hypothetical protein [Armatimonadaceae bacterium]
MPNMGIIRGDLADGLLLPRPLSLTQLTKLFDEPEVLVFERAIDSDALHGSVHLTLYSDGRYVFRGHMRATGFPSFSYRIQVFVRAVGAAIALETSGRVYGTDTPGDRQRDWNDSGTYEDVRKFWTALRRDPQFDVVHDSDLAGVTATLADIGQAALETYLAAQTGGVVGAFIVLGSNVGSASGITVRNPNLLVGITAGAGVYFAFGSGFIIPAVAAGVTAGALADIRFRDLNEEEVRRADEVFRGTLPVDRIVLTDLRHPSGGDNAFVYPALDGSIQVNMGRNYDNPLGPDVTPNSKYKAPGSLLMHELTHAWQIAHGGFMPGTICDALTDREYGQNVVASGSGRSWDWYGPEQQGSIVDSWYSEHLSAGLNSPAALADPRFRYIAENIRMGVN